jgi:hypothetical protein
MAMEPQNLATEHFTGQRPGVRLEFFADIEKRPLASSTPEKVPS